MTTRAWLELPISGSSTFEVYDTVAICIRIDIYAHTYRCTYVAHMCIYIHMYIHIRTCVQAGMYIYICTHVYTYICIHRSTYICFMIMYTCNYWEYVSGNYSEVHSPSKCRPWQSPTPPTALRSWGGRQVLPVCRGSELPEVLT